MLEKGGKGGFRLLLFIAPRGVHRIWVAVSRLEFGLRRVTVDISLCLAGLGSLCSYT